MGMLTIKNVLSPWHTDHVIVELSSIFDLEPPLPVGTTSAAAWKVSTKRYLHNIITTCTCIQDRRLTS